MTSLIANQVKTNMYFVQVKLFIDLPAYVPLFKLMPRINNNYNNNYSFDILICSQPFCKSHLYFILHTTEIFKHETSHKTDRLTDARFIFIYNPFSLQNVLKVEDLLFCLPQSSIMTAVKRSLSDSW